MSSAVEPNLRVSFLFFYNDTATTEIYTLSLHDALPIFEQNYDRYKYWFRVTPVKDVDLARTLFDVLDRDRKSTRLNSSHQIISYAVFCLKKKTQKNRNNPEVPEFRRSTPDDEHIILICV